MQIGMMNNPLADPILEARWAAEHGFEFLDLTMESPMASVDVLDVAALKQVLDTTGLGIVGHTAWYLPFGSPVPEVRRGAVDAVRATLDAFQRLGARYVNVHADGGLRSFPNRDTVRWNAESFAALADYAAPYGITIMVENVVNSVSNARAFGTILGAHEALRLHLDIAHANVKGDQADDFLRQHGERLVHVHISDNKRVSDDHLPLGVGEIDWPEQIGLLKGSGYDGTITLEVFTPDRWFLLDSVARLRRLWEAADKEIGRQGDKEIGRG